MKAIILAFAMSAVWFAVGWVSGQQRLKEQLPQQMTRRADALIDGLHRTNMLILESLPRIPDADGGGFSDAQVDAMERLAHGRSAIFNVDIFVKRDLEFGPHDRDRTTIHVSGPIHGGTNSLLDGAFISPEWTEKELKNQPFKAPRT